MTSSANRDALRQRWYDLGYYRRRTFPDEFRDGASRNPGSSLIFDSATRPGSILLGQLHDEGQRVAAGLRELGLRRGDYIACQVPNWVEGAVLYHAALTLGLVVVPIVHIYGPAEVGYILQRTGSKVLVIPDAWRNVDYPERVRAMSERSALDHVVVIGEAAPEWAVQFSDLRSATTLQEEPGIEADDVCMVMFTSGTTSRPKGVMHTHNTLLSEVRSWNLPDPTIAHEVHLSPYPAGHMGGVLGLARAFLGGGTGILIDAWDADRAVDLIRDQHVTSFAATPYFLRTLLDAAAKRDERLPTLREVNLGGAGVPPDLVREADRLGWGAYRTYGSTEHPTTTTATPQADLVIRATSDGMPPSGTEIRIVDDDEVDVPAGTAGEVLSRGPEAFVGYLDEADDDGAFAPGGWFRTGDVGVIGPDGQLTIVDRKKDIVIRGGENISSQEVESLLLGMPGVAEAAVIAVPDPQMGERVGAFVVPLEQTELTLDRVRAHFAAAGVARQKIPEVLRIVGELPRTALGKVKKAELRDQLKETHG